MAQCNEEGFLKDVAQHQIEIISDDGVNRHIRFKAPNTGNMYFDLITWPGYLCYTGDMGTYVFSRIKDMFEFFRTDRQQTLSSVKTLYINTGYWAEKLEAVDKRSGIKEFCVEKFNRCVIEYLVTWIRDHKDQTTKDERRDLWEAVIDEVMGADGDADSMGARKICAAYDFSHRVNSKIKTFHFQDFWEHNLNEYTFHFLWCCYALAWGIQQYDNLKESK